MGQPLKETVRYFLLTLSTLGILTVNGLAHEWMAPKEAAEVKNPMAMEKLIKAFTLDPNPDIDSQAGTTDVPECHGDTHIAWEHRISDGIVVDVGACEVVVHAEVALRESQVAANGGKAVDRRRQHEHRSCTGENHARQDQFV